MLDHFSPEAETLQSLLYVEEQIPVVEFFEVAKHDIKPEDCLMVEGVKSGENFSAYSHVIRIRKTANVDGLGSTDNMPNMGTDKLVFYNYDVHGNFHWQGVYSTALFTHKDYQILTR